MIYQLKKHPFFVHLSLRDKLNRIILKLCRGVAQLAAHRVWDAGVVGSSPTTPTTSAAE